MDTCVCLCMQMTCRSSANRSSRNVTSRTVSARRSDRWLTLSVREPVCRYASCRGTPSLSRSGRTPRRYSIAALTTSYDIARWRSPATTARRGRIGSASCAAVSVSATCARRTSHRVAPQVVDVALARGGVVVDVGASCPATRHLTDQTSPVDDCLCTYIALPRSPTRLLYLSTSTRTTSLWRQSRDRLARRWLADTTPSSPMLSFFTVRHVFVCASILKESRLSLECCSQQEEVGVDDVSCLCFHSTYRSDDMQSENGWRQCLNCQKMDVCPSSVNK